MRSAHARPPCRNRDAALCRFVALSTPRGITLRFAFGSARSQPSFRIESRASHRLPPAMFHLLHFLTASEAGGFAALVRARARPDAQRFLFPAARAAKRDSAARTQPSARRRRPRARAAPAKGRGEPPRSIATPARADCANVRPRGGRTDGGTFAPARLRHMQGAKRRTPFVIRNIVRERTHRPARPSADSRLSPRIGKPAVVTSASRCRAVCRQRRPPSANGFAARTCAAFFRRRNRQRASALPPPAHRVIARDPPRPRSTPDNTPAADPGTRPSRAADTRAHRDRIRPSRSPRRADRIRRSSRRPRPR
ncbi:Uncharacterised protein [Burkholderia pseudomallei]|nr:hypothetical protein DP45_0428 [Burkholderia pseudomallei]CAJ3515626.1 Uncharacterised protein [Burkholderia pseudomallei]CAJ3878643.1 Uncharacterised protein [Burkholderia pseudomallei]CAJ3922960.1 Uncharacterised protein [Burkholderia pseudomallei]CAJ4017094.1 Uncharacterised protein [Burkholderia pseudomallei]